MSRKYRDPVQVSGHGSGHGPGRFVWRGRCYEVRAVVSHWVEASVWWGGSRQVLEGAIPACEVEFWRVEARCGRTSQWGVYELCRETASERWLLSRALD